MDSIIFIMFLSVTCIFLSYGAAQSAQIDSIVKSSFISTANGETEESYVKRILDFWNEQRINEAIPKHLLSTESISISKNLQVTNDNKQSILIHPKNPLSQITSKRAGYPNTVGKVYFVDGSALYSCSASVVTADNNDTIITAGHCVYSTTNRAYVTNFIFIPQYDNSTNPTRPFGTWVARFTYTLFNWVSYLDLNSDVAAVLLYKLNNQHIQNVVGGQGIRFYSSHSGTVSSFGYPSNYISGQIMNSCSGTKYFANYSTYTGDAMPCSMNQGCSGGPWLESYNSINLTGILTSVNSFLIITNPNVIYGPYFGSSAQLLYNTAKVDISSLAVKLTSSFMSFLLILFHLSYIFYFR